MLIKIWYPNHCHGSDFLCFLSMNYDLSLRIIIEVFIQEALSLNGDLQGGPGLKIKS